MGSMFILGSAAGLIPGLILGLILEYRYELVFQLRTKTSKLTGQISDPAPTAAGAPIVSVIRGGKDPSSV